MLVDKYLDRADELDVDALCDKDGNVTICGIMQHIEQVCAVISCVDWHPYSSSHLHPSTALKVATVITCASFVH